MLFHLLKKLKPIGVIMKPLSSTTPGQALMWTLVAIIIAISAIALGQVIGHPNDGGIIWFIKGITVMTVSGYIGALTASWFSQAFFSAKLKKGSEE